jgi:hypothetical protein
VLTIGRSGHGCQTFGTRRCGKASIEGDEGDRLCQLPLEMLTTGELDRVARTKRMPQEKRTRIGRDLRNHLWQRRESRSWCCRSPI